MAIPGSELNSVGFKSIKPKLYHLGIFLCNSAPTVGPTCTVGSLLVFVGGKKVSATIHLRGLK